MIISLQYINFPINIVEVVFNHPNMRVYRKTDGKEYLVKYNNKELYVRRNRITKKVGPLIDTTQVNGLKMNDLQHAFNWISN